MILVAPVTTLDSLRGQRVNNAVTIGVLNIEAGGVINRRAALSHEFTEDEKAWMEARVNSFPPVVRLQIQILDALPTDWREAT